MPHGAAIVSSDSVIEPKFVEFDHLPKHWKFSFPQDFFPSKRYAIVFILFFYILIKIRFYSGDKGSNFLSPAEQVRPNDIVEVEALLSCSFHTNLEQYLIYVCGSGK